MTEHHIAWRQAVPSQVRPALLAVAGRVFWWGEPEAWLEDVSRFLAQVMTFGDWHDTVLTLTLLGEVRFRQVLANPPPGVFDVKSWTYWHRRYRLLVPPLPVRKL